jgi:adenosylmethionine-8-amino-7-oxononanoate aminotransferase
MVAQQALPVPQNASELAAFDTALAAIAPHTAALIVEPLVQGAGGIRFYPSDMLRAMREACQRYDVLFIADEIMTGFGRTGTMFACEAAGIVPDILCLGKGLSGGMLTLAATLATESIYQAFYGDKLEMALMHGPTYMANPLACAVANASLDLFEQEPRLEQVGRLAEQMEQGLRELTALPYVHEVRVRGAIGVVAFEPGALDPFAIRPRFIELGCWLRPFKDVIYLMPPFTIDDDALQHLLHSVRTVTHELGRYPEK